MNLMLVVGVLEQNRRLICGVCLVAGDCVSVVSVSEPGNMTSPNFPSAYPSDVNCRWTFVADVGYRVQLQFHVFDVERCGNCGCDRVQVHKYMSTYIIYMYM